MSAKEIVIGDISDAWAIGVNDKDGNAMDLAGFSCQMTLIQHSDGAEAIAARPVTLIDDGRFTVYLTDTETAMLVHNRQYWLVMEISNPNLPKPIKKEVRRCIRAVSGYIN